MARIREIVPGQQSIKAHKPEDGVICHYKVVYDEDGHPLLHLSTFGSDRRESPPKSSQSIQLDQQNAAELIQILQDTFDFPSSTRGFSPMPPGPYPDLPDASDEMADRLFIPKNWIQRCIDLLRDRPQLIFYGPPGTGKTFIAKAIAEHLCGFGNVRIVQFHPSYSYEDFFEGYRPAKSSDGQIFYDLHWGPLRMVADEARRNPDQTFTLIVDEINRGNLAKIFGELYYLLEYREESIDLMYSGRTERFSIPKNVIILGTMNTADRSIALIDSAMRRRFAFLSLHPSDDPVKSVLRKWLAAGGHPHIIADLVDKLNEEIGDEEFKIGPSYFMRPRAITQVGMDITWTTSIIPLLEEYHYGDRNTEVHERYSLESIRRKIGGGDDSSDE
ncbi:McrB family protein [Nocardia sp. NBC_00416]|uniref:McrB family protein n=1 Tax=Nocardia sp. NBC_00416 TaxID=2975991 RepID=UPI002E1E38EC